MLTLDQLISEATALPDVTKVILINKIVESMTKQIDRDQIEQIIEKTHGVVGGDACIKGTRIPVWELVEYRQLGASSSKILEAYPQLTTLDLQVAWDYHHSFPEEIAAAIAANEAA